MSNSDITTELRHHVLSIDNVLQAVSIGCCVTIIAGYCFIRFTDKTLDRLSLRLLVESCAFSTSFGVSQLLLNSYYAINSERKCNAVMGFFVASDIATALLMTCIAINLLLVIVYRTRIQLSMKALEIWYTGGSIALAAFMAITPFFSPDAVYSYSSELQQCWFMTSVPQTSTSIFWQFWLFHLWQMIGVVTTVICFAVVLVKLRQEEISIDENLESVQVAGDRWNCQCIAHTTKDTLPHGIIRYGSKIRERSSFAKFCLPRRWFSKSKCPKLTAAQAAMKPNRNVSYVGKTIRQAVCYSLALIITQIFNFACFINVSATSQYLPIYYFLSYFSTATRGPLILLCFLIDPALWQAFRKAGCLGKARASPKPSQKIRNADIPPSRKYSLTGHSEDIEEDVIIQRPESAYHALQSDGSNLSQTTH